MKLTIPMEGKLLKITVGAITFVIGGMTEFNMLVNQKSVDYVVVTL